MAEVNKKRLRWIDWVYISLFFAAIITYFIYNFINTQKNYAIKHTQEKQIAFVDIWSSQIREEMEHSTENAQIISSIWEGLPEERKDTGTSNMLNTIVEKTDYYRIVICLEDNVVGDSAGKSDFARSSYFTTDEKDFAYISDKDFGVNSSLAIQIPGTAENQYVLFFIDLQTFGDKFVSNELEYDSFLVLFKKDGTICGVFSKFSDIYSPFLQTGNFLNCVSKGNNFKDNYDIFKSKLYNNNSGAIRCEYDGDSRTIICSSVRVDNLYLGYGIKQDTMNLLVKDTLKDTNAASIELGVVFGILVSVIFGYSIYLMISSNRKKKSLENKADTDPLTELSNKVATERLIQEYIDENPNGKALMFILDVDNFKKVNDTMGHAFGDTLLKTLGKDIRAEFRLTDVVGRIGGDEFVIFLKDIKDDLIVERESNRIIRFFNDFKAGGDYVKYSATASIGAVLYPDDGKSFKELYVCADQALYKAKKQGKNRLVFFNDERNK